MQDTAWHVGESTAAGLHYSKQGGGCSYGKHLIGTLPVSIVQGCPVHHMLLPMLTDWSNEWALLHRQALRNRGTCLLRLQHCLLIPRVQQHAIRQAIDTLLGEGLNCSNQDTDTRGLAAPYQQRCIC